MWRNNNVWHQIPKLSCVRRMQPESIFNIIFHKKYLSTLLRCANTTAKDKAICQSLSLNIFCKIYISRYSDFIGTSRRLKSPATPLLVWPFVQAHIKKTSKLRVPWSLWGESTIGCREMYLWQKFERGICRCPRFDASTSATVTMV